MCVCVCVFVDGWYSLVRGGGGGKILILGSADGAEQMVF